MTPPSARPSARPAVVCRLDITAQARRDAAGVAGRQRAARYTRTVRPGRCDDCWRRRWTCFERRPWPERGGRGVTEPGVTPRRPGNNSSTQQDAAGRDVVRRGVTRNDERRQTPTHDLAARQRPPSRSDHRDRRGHRALPVRRTSPSPAQNVWHPSGPQPAAPTGRYRPRQAGRTQSADARRRRCRAEPSAAAVAAAAAAARAVLSSQSQLTTQTARTPGDEGQHGTLLGEVAERGTPAVPQSRQGQGRSDADKPSVSRHEMSAAHPGADHNLAQPSRRVSLLTQPSRRVSPTEHNSRLLLTEPITSSPYKSYVCFIKSASLTRRPQHNKSWLSLIKMLCTGYSRPYSIRQTRNSKHRNRLQGASISGDNSGLRVLQHLQSVQHNTNHSHRRQQPVIPTKRQPYPPRLSAGRHRKLSVNSRESSRESDRESFVRNQQRPDAGPRLCCVPIYSYGRQLS